MHRLDSDPLQALRQVGLENVATWYPRELSGGMKQRIALARALSYKAPIVLLDEPFASADEITRIELNRQLLSLWLDSGFTCIMTTHSISEAVMLADRILLLSANARGVTVDIPVQLCRPRDLEVLASSHYAELIRSVTEGLKQ